MTNELQTELSRLPFAIRRIYLHLDAPTQIDFNRQFHRHITMCRKIGVTIDPFWVRETLMDSKKEFSTLINA